MLPLPRRFPYHEKSFHFALIAAGLDIVQDHLARSVLWRAEDRHDNPCRYRRIIPGWLLRPRRLRRAIRGVMCAMWCFAVLTQLGFVWKQQGFLVTGADDAGSG